MIGEAANPAMVPGQQQQSAAAVSRNGETMYFPTIAARHGKVSANGNNALPTSRSWRSCRHGSTHSLLRDYVSSTMTAPNNVGGPFNPAIWCGVVFTLNQDQVIPFQTLDLVN